MNDDFPEARSEVPGGGWFGYSSEIDSIERDGLSWAKYHKMLRAQDGECAICGRHATSVGPLVVDHDHDSKRVRGLLCHACNLGLGHFHDDPYLLRWASEYLVARGCATTKPLPPEVEESLAPFVESPEQCARRLADEGRTYRLELILADGRRESAVYRSEARLAGAAAFEGFGTRWEITGRGIIGPSDDNRRPLHYLMCKEARA